MMANLITGLRIIVSAALLFCPVFSPIFYVSRFDSIADLVFVVVCLIKILPVMDIPIWLYVWTVLIAVIRIFNIISGFAVQKKYVAVHTTMNKVTGVLLFMLPLTLSIVPLIYTGIPICSVATFAAVQEGHFIRTGKGID